MYAKINGGTIEKFPYTFGDLRRDHPNVSFPKNITQRIMSKYGMVGVLEGPKPTEVGPYQRVQRDALPIRPTITEEVPDATTESGTSIVEVPAHYWMIHYTAVDMFEDTTDEEGNVTTKAEHEAAYQASLDEKAAETNRAERDRLIAETDWWASSDLTMTDEQTAYRQALRDITTHANWPHLEENDWPTKPE